MLSSVYHSATLKALAHACELNLSESEPNIIIINSMYINFVVMVMHVLQHKISFVKEISI